MSASNRNFSITIWRSKRLSYAAAIHNSENAEAKIESKRNESFHILRVSLLNYRIIGLWKNVF